MGHILSPTQTKKPTKFTWPTREPTTLSTSLNPTGSPTITTTNNDDDYSLPAVSTPTTELPIITPSEDPTKCIVTRLIMT